MTERLLAVVDDDEGVRDSLAALFGAHGYRVVEFANAEGFLARAYELGFDCVLLDIRLPDMNGIQALDALRRQGLDPPVIIMTGFGDVPLAVSAMKAGACDFIEKPFPTASIIQAVDDAVAASKTEQQPSGIGGVSTSKIDSLTPREREVLKLLVEGLQNKMVARRLNISPRTAEVHRANIMRKLDASSFSHLIRMALAANI